MTDKLPPLPDLGWSCLCTKCGRTWEIDKPQKSADCQCGYAAFVVQNKRPTVEQMQDYARQAVREAVPEAVRKEAGVLAGILSGMCEGGYTELDTLYTEDQADGDAFVKRAAEVLGMIAAAKEAK